MPENPISNPGVTPTPGSPEYGRDKPRLGEGEEAQQQKPFSLAPEGSETAPSEVKSEHPTPMDVAGDAAQQHPQLSPEELSSHVAKLQNNLSTLQSQLQGTKLKNQFTPEHFQAMQKVTEKMNPDMRTIAKNSKGEFNPPQHTSGENVAGYLTKWLNGSQGTLSSALDYLQTTKKPEIGSYLKLQYAVQRATQRGELFASIVGATVSGIKTIMSTQLG